MSFLSPGPDLTIYLKNNGDGVAEREANCVDTAGHCLWAITSNLRDDIHGH